MAPRRFSEFPGEALSLFARSAAVNTIVLNFGSRLNSVTIQPSLYRCILHIEVME